MANTTIRNAARGVIVRDEKILLIEYQDENNRHYNIPGGGVKFGESLRATVQREVLEETCIIAEVHDLLFVYEHLIPDHNDPHSLSFFFRCSVASDAVAQMPATPDLHQTAVKWLPLADFVDALLYPHVNQQILDAFSQPPRNIFVETIPMR